MFYYLHVWVYPPFPSQNHNLPVGVVTSLVVMIVPLLLTTIIGELLLLGKVAVTGLGRILLGCTCWVIILTPRKGERSLLKYRHEKLLSEMFSQTKPWWASSLTRLLFWDQVFLILKKMVFVVFFFFFSDFFANNKTIIIFAFHVPVSIPSYSHWGMGFHSIIDLFYWSFLGIDFFHDSKSRTHFPGTNRLQPIPNWIVYSEGSKNEEVLHIFSL